MPLGDYLAGSNHVLPTGGTARFASGLGVQAFLKSVQVIDYDAAEKPARNRAHRIVYTFPLTEEFKALLVRTYANAVTSYSNQKLVVKPLKMKAGETEVLVRSEVLQPGAQPVQLDYWLEQQGDAWKVFDVVVAGISLVTNYREQFAKEVRDNGIDGLISTLAAKNKSLETSAAAKTARK